MKVTALGTPSVPKSTGSISLGVGGHRHELGQPFWIYNKVFVFRVFIILVKYWFRSVDILIPVVPVGRWRFPIRVNSYRRT
jgi:hypothetical protein